MHAKHTRDTRHTSHIMHTHQARQAHQAHQEHYARTHAHTAHHAPEEPQAHQTPNTASTTSTQACHKIDKTITHMCTHVRTSRTALAVGMDARALAFNVRTYARDRWQMCWNVDFFCFVLNSKRPIAVRPTPTQHWNSRTWLRTYLRTYVAGGCAPNATWCGTSFRKDGEEFLKNQ